MADGSDLKNLKKAKKPVAQKAVKPAGSFFGSKKKAPEPEPEPVKSFSFFGSKKKAAPEPEPEPEKKNWWSF